MGFYHVSQAGLELLTSGDPPASASQSAGIRGMSHRAQAICAFSKPHSISQLSGNSESWNTQDTGVPLQLPPTYSSGLFWVFQIFHMAGEASQSRQKTKEEQEHSLHGGRKNECRANEGKAPYKTFSSRPVGWEVVEKTAAPLPDSWLLRPVPYLPAANIKTKDGDRIDLADALEFDSVLKGIWYQNGPLDARYQNFHNIKTAMSELQNLV
ncbi:Zinc finger protein 701 [Plecturocebus cupreus]